MGVHGLWQLLQPTGRTVTLETLEGQVLAVDISIWLNQIVKGLRDQQGNTVPNAHLIGLFKRVCKLLYYRIKPVFVFDGGVPALKKHTLAQRRQHREEMRLASSRTNKSLLKSLLKQRAVRDVLDARSGKAVAGVPAESSRDTSTPSTSGTSNTADLFVLPPVPATEGDELEVVEENDDDAEQQRPELDQLFGGLEDPEEVDIHSEDFKSLPMEIQHELLTEIKELRKENAWKHAKTLPQESNDFSQYQLAKLMRQNALSSEIRRVRREMATEGASGVDTGLTVTMETVESHRVMSAENAHYVLLKGVREVTSEAQQDTEQQVTNRETVSQFRNPQGKRFDSETSSSKLQSKSSSQGENARGDSRAGRNVAASPRGAHLRASQGGSRGNMARVCLSSEESGDDSDQDRNSQTIRLDTTIKAQPSGANSTSGLQSPLEKAEVDEGLSSGNPAIVEANKQIDFSEDNAAVVEVTDSMPEDEDLIPLKKRRVEVTSVQQSNPNLSPDFHRNVEPDDGNSSSDESFIEVTIDTNNIQPDDEMFPPSLFIATPLEKSESSETDKTVVEEALLPDAAEAVSEPVEPQVVLEPGDVIESASEHAEPAVEVPNEAEEAVEFDTGLSQSDLVALEGDLSQEIRDLESQRGQQERVASTITDQMYTEAQDLLRLFGLPFIVSPTEAEAQCAFLDVTGQTNGSITDDSDVWLFGGRRVYRNFFNQNRAVEAYRIQDIENQLLLDREKLVLLAMLCGCDYTDGIDGVGPVTAMEVLAEFSGPGLKGLQKLKLWWDKAQDEHMPPVESKLRKKLRSLHIKPGFPNDAILKAFLEPTIEDSQEKFSWGKPDLDLLREYAQTKLAWTRAKTDELLLPVIKQLSSTQTQLRITSFVEPQTKNNLKSRRVKNSLARRKNTTTATKTKGKTSSSKTSGRTRTGRANSETVAGGGWGGSVLPPSGPSLSESSSESDRGFDSSGDEILGDLDLDAIQKKN